MTFSLPTTKWASIVSIALILSPYFFAMPALRSEESTQAKKQRMLRYYNDLTREDTERIWKQIIGTVDAQDAEKLRQVKLDYSIDETPLRFEARPGERPVLYVTAGGILLQNVILEAYALVNSGYTDKLWLNEYILYLRKQHLGHFGFYSASVAAGIIGQKQIDGLSQDFKRQYLFYRNSALFFILAHEAAHILQNDAVEQLDDERDKAYEQRIQMQEIRADEIATALMTKTGELPAGFAMLLMASLLIYEPRDSIVDANLHVPDRARIRTLSRRILDAVAKDTRMETKYRSMIDESVKTIFMVTEPKNYVAMLKQRDAQLRHASFGRLNLPAPSD